MADSHLKDGFVAGALLATHAGALGAIGATLFTSSLPIIAGAGAVAIACLGTAYVSTQVAPARRARRAWVARRLRRLDVFEGVVVPLRLVSDPESRPVVAFQHGVARCDACDCVMPCGDVPRFFAEDCEAGRFLVRRADGALALFDGTMPLCVVVDGPVESSKAASSKVEASRAGRSGSFLHRVEPGAHVRVHAELAPIDAPEDVAASFAGLRETPTVLAPPAGATVLVELVPLRTS